MNNKNIFEKYAHYDDKTLSDYGDILARLYGACLYEANVYKATDVEKCKLFMLNSEHIKKYVKERKVFNYVKERKVFNKE